MRSKSGSEEVEVMKFEIEGKGSFTILIIADPQRSRKLSTISDLSGMTGEASVHPKATGGVEI